MTTREQEYLNELGTEREIAALREVEDVHLVLKQLDYVDGWVGGAAKARKLLNELIALRRSIARLLAALAEIRASLSEAKSAYFEEVIAHCIRTADAALKGNGEGD